MKHKFFALLLAAILLCSGCSLAQDQRSAAAQDRFAGYYAVYESFAPPRDMTGWVEYASLYPELKFSHQAEPYLVSVGEKQADGSYTFPGKDGRALFVTLEKTEAGLEAVLHNDLTGTAFNAIYEDENGGITTVDMISVSSARYKEAYAGVPDMGPPDPSTEGMTYELKGTLPVLRGVDQADGAAYCFWVIYSVYQTPEGAVYLQYSEDPPSWGGGAGGLTYHSPLTFSTVISGQEVTQTTDISITFDTINPLAALHVYQYGEGGKLLSTQELPTEGELPAVAWHDEAIYAVIEEVRLRWPGQADTISTHTAYERLAETAYQPAHEIVMLDETGTGYVALLTFE